MVMTYFNRYTAICDTCSALMSMKLRTSPYPHNLCPCCHQQLLDDPPLSLCADCMQDIVQDGYAESPWGSWHLDGSTGKIVCIALDFNLPTSL